LEATAEIPKLDEKEKTKAPETNIRETSRQLPKPMPQNQPKANR